MCGLVANFAYGDAAARDPDATERALDSMVARGPDGRGTWRSEDGRVALGHVRLAIIDISPSGSQPMESSHGGLCIVFNGEIYNYAELRDELRARGYVFNSTSDTEVLLNLYLEFGIEMMPRLRGMYAFALWDGRRKGMLLGRDPFGIKPLYVANDGGRIAAASQVKALLAMGGIDTRRDAAGVVGFHLWGHVPEPYTLHRGIRAVPPGSTLWIDQGGCRGAVRFFDLREEIRASERVDCVTDLLARAGTLRDALQDTVRHHLVADVPVGVFLSAGLDSTTLARSAHELGHRVRTVTLGFEEYAGTPSDEVPIAEEVARTFGFDHRTVHVSRSDFESESDRLFEAMDQPTVDGVNTYFVSYAARRAGMKVVLSGLGGDELLGGYASFGQIPSLVRYTAPFRPLGAAVRFAARPIVERITSPKYAGLLEYGGTWSGAYLLRKSLFMPWELPQFLDRDLVREGWNELQTLVRLDESHQSISDAMLKITALECKWYMGNQLLRDSDWASMAHSIELRTPFVDVPFFRALLPMMRGKDRPTKRTLAACLSVPLPAALANRRKTGFSIPLRNWLHAGAGAGAAERGLRGWAKLIYQQFDAA